MGGRVASSADAWWPGQALSPGTHSPFPIPRAYAAICQGVFTRVGQEMDVNLAEEAIIQNFPINPRGPGATLGPWRSLLLSV